MSKVFIAIALCLAGTLAQTCEKQLTSLLAGLEKGSSWALIMRDAWGVEPSGISSGNRVNYGHFSQCVSFKHQHPTLGLIQGQNCMLTVRRHIPQVIDFPTFRAAVCIPASCAAHEVSSLLESYFNSTLELSIDAPATDTDCEKLSDRPENVTSTKLFWCAVAFFVLTVAWALVATIYERLRSRASSDDQKKLPASEFVTSFSVYSNLVQAMRFQEDARSAQLGFLDGLRAISVLWIIYQHTFFQELSFPLINDNYKYQWAHSPFAMTFLSASVAVDNFLLISGLLVTWNFFHDRHKRKSLNCRTLMKTYLSRYVRLTSALAPLVLFTMAFYRSIGSGPEHVQRTEWIVKSCDDHWWTTLLHIHNFVNRTFMCVPHSWYVRVDFQLFLLTPLLLIPLWKWGRKFLGVLVCLILVITAYIFIICMIFDDIFISYFMRDTWHRMVLLYIATETKAATWLVGMLVGYFLFEVKDRNFSIPRKFSALMWLACIMTMLAIIFGPIEAHTAQNANPRWEIATYEAFHRLGWSLCMSWIIVSCSVRSPSNKPVARFLSHPVWKPLSRISFSIYLVHLMLQFLRTASRKTNQYFSNVDTLHSFFGDTGFAIMVGLAWYLLYEAPYQRLTKLYLSIKPAPSNAASPNITA